MSAEEQKKEPLCEELERLRRQNAELLFYKHVLEQHPVGTVVYDHEGKVVYRNQATKTVDGYGVKELIGLSREAYLQLLRIQPDAGSTKNFFAGGDTDKVCRLIETTIKTKDDSVKNVLLTGNYIFDQEDLLGACECTLDISGCVRIEQEMANRLQFSQQLIDTIPSPVYYKDVTGLYMGCNVAFEEQLGQTREAITGRTERDIFPGATGDRAFEMDRQLFENPGTQAYETTFRHADGSLRNAIVHKAVYYNRDGAVAGLVGVITDITERKKTEKELRVSNESFTSIFDAGPMPIAIMSMDGRLLTVNAGFIAAIGYTAREIIGKTVEELKLTDNRADAMDIINEVAAKGTVKNREIKFRGKNGETRVGLLSSKLIELDGEQRILAAFLDYTDRKRMEEDMARLDRMSLIGQIAAGIGHEVRNPITSVRGFMQLLENKEECQRFVDYFRICINELDRANAIITDFLSLARVKPVGFIKHNINGVLKDILPLIRADAAVSDKHIVAELKEIPDISLNEKDIHQLVINLVRNGVEAMTGKGNVTIRTYLEKDRVVLAVRDEGPGIDPEVMRKLGTPFFTTKDTGTGLGLAVCYSIAQRHGADIDVESTPDGTTFMVRFLTDGA